MNTMSEDYSKFRAEFRVKKTRNGYDFLKILSATQKYIRRSEYEKAVKCAIEVNTFLELEIADENVLEMFKKQTNTCHDYTLKRLHTVVSGIRTNFINRLIVIMSEEININDKVEIPIIMYDLYNSWQNSRKQEISIEYLINMIFILCNAKKARLLSYLKSAYTLPPFYTDNMVEYYSFINDIIYPKFIQLDLRSRSDNYDIENFSKSIIDKDQDKTFRCLGEMIKQIFDPNLKNIYDLFKSIWKILNELSISNITLNKSIIALNKFYKIMNHVEKPLYLYHALALLINKDKLDFESIPTNSVTNYKILLSEYNKNPIIYIDPNKNREYFEEYILDIHTGKKKNLQSYIDLEKSFYIDPEKFNKKFILPDYEQLYYTIKYAIGSYKDSSIGKLTIQGLDDLSKDKVNDENIDLKLVNMKMFEENSKKMKSIDSLLELYSIQTKYINSKDINEFPLIQKRTGRNKKFNRIDFNNKFIIKGPYKNTDKDILYAIKYNIALQFLDSVTNYKTAIPWYNIYIDEINQYYLVSKFVTNNIMIESDRNKIIKKILDQWSNTEFQYFERDSNVVGIRISDIFKNQLLLEKLLDTNLKQHILQHLYLRYILGIGDTGPHNMLYVDNILHQVIGGFDLEEFRSEESYFIEVKNNPYKLLFNVNHNTYLHHFPYELFESLNFIDWTNEDFINNLESIFDKHQIISMITRDNIYKKLLGKKLTDISLILTSQEEKFDIMNQEIEEKYSMKKKITFNGNVLSNMKKGKVYIMSVKRGQKWPEKRLEIINKLGEKNVLLLNVTSQSIRYRETFSPMYIPNNHIYKDTFYCFENWYQSGKVLEGISREERLKWWKDQKKGYRKFPKTDFKLNPVLYCLWEQFGDKKLNYIESRKLAYVPEYWNLIKDKSEFLKLKSFVNNGLNIIIIDQDGPYSEDGSPDILEVNLEILVEKINDIKKPFGHGYIVAAGLLDIDHNLYIYE